MNALILVDLQHDFLPGGALAVGGGDEIPPLANGLMDAFDCVVATQDWHPANHGSFAANHPGSHVGQVIELHGLPQVLWPIHCVQGTRGAEFSSALNVSGINRVFHKGTDPTIDSYSGLYDNGHRKSTGLKEYLKERSVLRVYILGLATDYCVKFTALDAAAEGFQVYLIEDACRGVDLRRGDVSDALTEMKFAGVTMIKSSDVMKLLAASSLAPGEGS